MAESRALLEAVADGRAEDADALATALANAVLDVDVVRLARQVNEGGPLRIARAMSLAEKVATALHADEPASPNGTSDVGGGS